MDITLENVIILATALGTVIGIYSNYAAKMKVMEKEIEDLKDLVNELRLDIKELLQQK